jgi:hypothetical protein
VRSERLWAGQGIPGKELEALLKEAERKGWRVVKGSKYFKMYCPCSDQHWTTIHLTPSDPNYERNLRGLRRRETCWEARP